MLTSFKHHSLYQAMQTNAFIDVHQRIHNAVMPCITERDSPSLWYLLYTTVLARAWLCPVNFHNGNCKLACLREVDLRCTSEHTFACMQNLAYLRYATTARFYCHAVENENGNWTPAKRKTNTTRS